MKKSHLCKNTFKTNEISTFPPSRSVPRTTPDDQNHPRGAPGPPPDTLRKLHVFSEPPGPPPRSLRGLPGTPPGTPRDPPGTPRTPQSPPDDLPRTSAGTQQSHRTPPATSRDPPLTRRDPQGTPNIPQGPPPQFGPAECAERLNKIYR